MTTRRQTLRNAIAAAAAEYLGKEPICNPAHGNIDDMTAQLHGIHRALSLKRVGNSSGAYEWYRAACLTHVYPEQELTK